MHSEKKTLDIITRRFFSTENKNLFHTWFGEFSDAFKERIVNKNVEPFTYMAPLENGEVLYVDVRPPFATVTHIKTDMEKEIVLSPEQFIKNNYSSLKSLGNKLKSEKIGLSFPYPFVLRNLIKGLHQDEIVTFDNGLSFLCCENDDNGISLRKVCGNVFVSSSLTALYTVGNTFGLSLSDKEMLNLYSKIKSPTSDSIKGRKVSVFAIQKAIKEIEKKVEKNSERRIDLGPLILKYKRTMMSGSKWLNEDGQTVNQAQLIQIFAWMHSAPVFTEYKRKESTAEKQYNDNLFDEKLEMLFKEGRFDTAIKEIATYCMNENGDLEFLIKSYVPEGDDFVATGFQFVSAEDGVIIRRGYYEDNDINNHLESLKKVPPRIFLDFCEEKFKADYFVIKNKKREIIMKEMPKIG